MPLRDFGQKLKGTISGNKDTIGKGTSRGADWCKFKLHA